jgi:hypothetical protein
MSVEVSDFFGLIVTPPSGAAVVVVATAGVLSFVDADKDGVLVAPARVPLVGASGDTLLLALLTLLRRRELTRLSARDFSRILACVIASSSSFFFASSSSALVSAALRAASVLAASASLSSSENPCKELLRCMARLVPPPASALASAAGAVAVAAAPSATSAPATDAGRDKLGGRLPPLTGDREAAGAPCMLAGRRATFPSPSGVRGWRLRCDPGLRSGGGKSRERETDMV